MSTPEPGPAADLLLWRAYVPRWSHAPLSGDGAARFGGRWNRVGQPCLYAAHELSTAWAEYNQGFVQHPALVARLDVGAVRLADLTRTELQDELGVSSDIHRCDWRAMLSEGMEPPTHALAARLQSAGWDGVTYPSVMSPGGRCAALWRWNAAGGPTVAVVDPENRLPHSAQSWS